MRVVCLLLCSTMIAYAAEKSGVLEPNYSGSPNADWASKPHPAKSSSDQVDIPVMYSPIQRHDQGEGKNPTHVRAGDGKVIISQDPMSSYNASGSYQNKAAEKCCTICPQAEDCESDCYSKCHRFCGEQCQIGKAGNECTIGIDCGLTNSDKSISGDQDMVTGYEKMKAPAGRDAKTPEAPLEGEERFPVPERAQDKRATPDVADIASEPRGEVKDPYPAVDAGATGPTEPTASHSLRFRKAIIPTSSDIETSVFPSSSAKVPLSFLGGVDVSSSTASVPEM